MAYTTITDPSAHFQIALYTGDGSSSQAQTNTGNSDLQPDWIVIKKRNGVRNTTVTDSSRGFNKRLQTSVTSAETTTTTDVISAQSNGFTVGNNGSTGEDGDTYVAWQWKSNGGTTASNSNGTIASTVQANTTAGFNIVTWTGNGNQATIGHGLGVTPSWIIAKSRNVGGDWRVWHQSLSAAEYMTLNSTTTVGNSNSVWGTSPAQNATTFSIGTNTDVNQDTKLYLAYCFAEKQGYSKFGKYIGNGNADGPFVYTGFKPAWILSKGLFTKDWVIVDNKRNTFNVVNKELFPNTSAAEASNDRLDFLSNGFKITSSGAQFNNSGSTYLYMAFAQNPLVATNGVPATAR